MVVRRLWPHCHFAAVPHPTNFDPVCPALLWSRLLASCACRKVGESVGRHLPPVLILHGTADKSVPMEVAVEFVAALKVG